MLYEGCHSVVLSARRGDKQFSLFDELISARRARCASVLPAHLRTDLPQGRPDAAMTRPGSGRRRLAGALGVRSRLHGATSVILGAGERQQGFRPLDHGPLLVGVEDDDGLGIVSIRGLVGDANDRARQRQIEPNDIPVEFRCLGPHGVSSRQRGGGGDSGRRKIDGVVGGEQRPRLTQLSQVLLPVEQKKQSYQALAYVAPVAGAKALNHVTPNKRYTNPISLYIISPYLSASWGRPYDGT